MSLLEHRGLLVAMQRGLFYPRTEGRKFGTAGTLVRHLRSRLHYCLVGAHRAQCGMNSYSHLKSIHPRIWTSLLSEWQRAHDADLVSARLVSLGC